MLLELSERWYDTAWRLLFTYCSKKDWHQLFATPV